MDVLNEIYAAIAAEGFTDGTLQMIDNYVNDIRYGRKDFNGFTLSEHAGLCKGGSPLKREEDKPDGQLYFDFKFD